MIVFALLLSAAQASAQNAPASQSTPSMFAVAVPTLKGDGTKTVEQLITEAAEKYKFHVSVESDTPGLKRAFQGTIIAGTLRERLNTLLQFGRAYGVYETKALLIYGSVKDMTNALTQRPYESVVIPPTTPAPSSQTTITIEKTAPPPPAPPIVVVPPPAPKTEVEVTVEVEKAKVGPPAPQSNVTDTLTFSPAQTCIPAPTVSTTVTVAQENLYTAPAPGQGMVGGMLARRNALNRVSYGSPSVGAYSRSYYRGRVGRTWHGVVYFEDLLYEDQTRRLEHSWTTGLIKLKGRKQGSEEFLKRVSVVALITNPDCSTTVVNIIDAAQGNSKFWDHDVPVPIQNGVARLLFILEDGSDRPRAFSKNQWLEPKAVSGHATEIIVMPEKFETSQSLYDLRQHVFIETPAGQIVRKP